MSHKDRHSRLPQIAATLGPLQCLPQGLCTACDDVVFQLMNEKQYVVVIYVLNMYFWSFGEVHSVIFAAFLTMETSKFLRTGVWLLQ